MMVNEIKSLYLEEAIQAVREMGGKDFQGKQLFQWLHQKQVDSYSVMTNLPGAVRKRLEEECHLLILQPVETQISALDGTRKYLFAMPDGQMVESVWMHYRHGDSVCISSQAGCRMGCRFCASTIGGLVRNLTAQEMLEQVYAVGRAVGKSVSHVVVMGTGEPLDNYENLLRFIRILNHEQGMRMSQRNITVSTCGIVPKIYELAREKLQITLALSLHGATDEKRQELMPIAKKYPLSEVMEACDFYFKNTGRRITYEYSLIRGVNDTQEDAQQLANLLRHRNCHVNLIPVNPVKERGFCQSEQKIVDKFKNKLEKYGINVTIRREMGRDIDGACGQLRRRHMDTDAVQ
ncbi:MAG: 23S rRNA (adenine(2503)-C(2))-methyltransferase RlmN [Lachnospiraceae bacterium]|nr:23S rRNA (adenine(2503)-C(2))-methyltransferase RlmN [Lachnospiraceae bacterium]